MRYENKYLIIVVIAFAGAITGILLINGWISRQMKDIDDVTAEKSAVPRVVAESEQIMTKPHPVIIDPLNDPLAPVIPRNPKPKAVAPRSSAPEEVYEPSLDTDILVQ